MRHFLIPLLLSLIIPAFACDGQNATRFINMQIVGEHDLGKHGTYTLINTDGTLSITIGDEVASDLVWGANPNVLIARFNNHGVVVQIKGKGNAKWLFFKNKYKDATPAANDYLSLPTVETTGISSEHKPRHKVTTFRNKPSKKDKDTNGHGNNKDGVDKSNPGKAPKKDSDPDVDDEVDKAKKKDIINP